MIASLVIINQLVYISVCVCRACNANKLDIIARSGDMWHFANLSPSNLALCISGLLSLSLARLWLREIFVSAEELWSQTSPNGTSAICEPLEISHPDFHFLLPSLPSGVGRIGSPWALSMSKGHWNVSVSHWGLVLDFGPLQIQTFKSAPLFPSDLMASLSKYLYAMVSWPVCLQDVIRKIQKSSNWKS